MAAVAQDLLSFHFHSQDHGYCCFSKMHDCAPASLEQSPYRCRNTRTRMYAQDSTDPVPGEVLAAAFAQAEHHIAGDSIQA